MLEILGRIELLLYVPGMRGPFYCPHITYFLWICINIMVISLVVAQFIRFSSPELKIILVHTTYEDGAVF